MRKQLYRYSEPHPPPNHPLGGEGVLQQLKIVHRHISQSGVAGRVQITDATRQRLGEAFLSEERGAIEIEGMDKRIPGF